MNRIILKLSEMPHSDYDENKIIDFQIEKMPISNNEKLNLFKAFYKGKGIIGKTKGGKILKFTSRGVTVLKNIPLDTNKSSLLPREWEKYAKILNDKKYRIKRSELRKMIWEIVERSLGHLKYNIKILVHIDKTKHAEIRQGRHDEEIIDGDIKQSVDRASPRIIRMLMFNDIDINDKIIVCRKSDYLHIVGILLKENPGVLRFEVITVMKEKNFYNKPGTPIIYI